MDWFIRRLDVVERCMEKKEETCVLKLIYSGYVFFNFIFKVNKVRN